MLCCCNVTFDYACGTHFSTCAFKLLRLARSFYFSHSRPYYISLDTTFNATTAQQGPLFLFIIRFIAKSHPLSATTQNTTTTHNICIENMCAVCRPVGTSWGTEEQTSQYNRKTPEIPTHNVAPYAIHQMRALERYARTSVAIHNLRKLCACVLAFRSHGTRSRTSDIDRHELANAAQPSMVAATHINTNMHEHIMLNTLFVFAYTEREVY